MATISENRLEQKLIKNLEAKGYERILIKDYSELEGNLKTQLEKLNNETFSDMEFQRILTHLKGDSLFEKSIKLRHKFNLPRDDNTTKYISFLNTENWCKNEFQVANQITKQKEGTTNRYDVTLLINGLPLVQIELKKAGIPIKEAFNQIERYKRDTYDGLFHYIQVFVISNKVNTRYFVNNAKLKEEFVFTWKDENNKNINDLYQFSDTFLDKCHIAKMISKYTVLNEGIKQLMILRPYQYYAVEKIIKRVEDTNNNGYIWHTTGSGKTLTSFKASQLLKDKENVDKVIFIVDRRDLNHQTNIKFNHYASDSVKEIDNTRVLEKNLLESNDIIITTIQRLSSAIRNSKYDLDSIKDDKIILMFDECHRSQFGKMHNEITKYFTNIQSFGFTGTPIFQQNQGDLDSTTAQVFDECLHTYVIKDAIKDGNVLKFLINYPIPESKGKLDEKFEFVDKTDTVQYEHPKKIEANVDYIIKNHNRFTLGKRFTSILTVNSVEFLIKYYKLFKSKNSDLKVAAIFSTQDNDDFDEDGYQKRDYLKMFMADYNEMFGTNFSYDNYDAYNSDISDKSKKNKIDILLVVDMYLTGFDNELLNTIYVDKNLEYHKLIQAFSRTNRLYDKFKTAGNVVCFRPLQDKVDEALILFSKEGEANETIATVIDKTYQEYLDSFNNAVKQLNDLVPDVQDVDDLSTDDIKKFIEIFKNILKIKNRIVLFDEYQPTQLDIDDERINEFKSKYRDINERAKNDSDPRLFEDIDFEMNLLEVDDVNVDYILDLISKLDSKEPSYEENRDKIISEINSSIEPKSKRDLITGFIINKKPYIGDSDIYTSFDEFLETKKQEDINKIVHNPEFNSRDGTCKLDIDALNELLSEYEFSGKIKPQLLENCLKGTLKFKEKIIKRNLLRDYVCDFIAKYKV